MRLFQYFFLVNVLNSVANAISGGEIAKEGSFKYQVSIWEVHIATCSGAVLDEWRILTVAVCVDTFPEEYYTVSAGSVIQADRNSLFYYVERIYVHPDYNRDNNNETNFLDHIPNNMAVLILQQPLALGEHIQRISLPTEETLPYCSFCTIAGWGLHGKVLKWTFQMIYKPGVCEHMWDSKHRHNEFCAMDPSGFSNLQEGDQGGPLVCDGIAVGIYVPSNIHLGFPFYFTKIFSFLAFINGAQKIIVTREDKRKREMRKKL